MNYQVGTKIMIRPDIRETEFSFSVTEDMLVYRGKIGEIVGTTRFDRDCYKVSVDGGDYNWDEEWLTVPVLNKGKNKEV